MISRAPKPMFSNGTHEKWIKWKTSINYRQKWKYNIEKFVYKNKKNDFCWRRLEVKLSEFAEMYQLFFHKFKTTLFLIGSYIFELQNPAIKVSD